MSRHSYYNRNSYFYDDSLDRDRRFCESGEKENNRCADCGKKRSTGEQLVIGRFIGDSKRCLRCINANKEKILRIKADYMEVQDEVVRDTSTTPGPDVNVAGPGGGVLNGEKDDI